MKRLLVIRHAKSAWPTGEVKDFDRPLNERGVSDAPMMANRLIKLRAVPDLLVASPAKRASSTAKLFGGEWGYMPDEIIYKPELYHAPASVFYDVISSIDSEYNTIAIFSHNPGITEFVNQLTPTEVRLDNMPTSAVFGVQVDLKSWADFDTAKKKFWFLDYPKAEKPQLGK